MSVSDKEEWLHCNVCGRDNDHRMVHSHRNKEYSEDCKDGFGNVINNINGSRDWQLLECQGCKTVWLRLREYCSEWGWLPDEDPCEYTCFPPRNTGTRVKPHWFDTFSTLDNLQGHFILISYKQIYQLIEANQYLAALLTSRALLETIAIENGVGDMKTFRQKLEGLCEKEFIRRKQIDFLEKAIYDSGSAAMHRSYNPTATTVTYVLDAIEHLIHTIYIEPIVDLILQEEKPKRERLS